jgi:uncharacterized protein
MIFVDTGIWFAAYVDEDPNHARADALLTGAPSSLVVTDYVVDELLTLFVSRGYRRIATVVGQLQWSESVCQIEWVARDDVAAAWRIFESFDDKRWSFTDCVSYVVMQRLGIREAFSLDEHFRQFGFVTVTP